MYLRGEVEFLTGGESPRAGKPVDLVKFQGRQ